MSVTLVGMVVPANPKIYHIAHVDRLPSIIEHGLLCDAEVLRRGGMEGTTIGMSKIKQRRLHELTLDSHPDLYVGECVPFYFCPRSVMLYMFHVRSDKVDYRDGQDSIIHLQADLRAAVDWLDENQQRWAFSLTNAGSKIFDDRCDLGQLHELDWETIRATYWSDRRDAKQAEFLAEQSFPWHLIDGIGVHNEAIYTNVVNKLPETHRPKVAIKNTWYY